MHYKETRTYYFEKGHGLHGLNALGGTLCNITNYDDCVVVDRFYNDYDQYCDSCKDMNVKGYKRLTVKHGQV